MLKSEKYQYGSMWTVTGFWNRVTHWSDKPATKAFVLYPLALCGGMFGFMFTVCGGFLFTGGRDRYRKRQAEIWRHREMMEALKSKSQQ